MLSIYRDPSWLPENCTDLNCVVNIERMVVLPVRNSLTCKLVKLTMLTSSIAKIPPLRLLCEAGIQSLKSLSKHRLLTHFVVTGSSS